VLQDAGYVVEVAQDTTLGALKLMAHKPDLMILDLNMPGVDGFTFIEHVKEVTTPPPIVFLSGSRNLETVLRGVALGVFAFLPKPVNFTALVETCRAALAKAGAQGAAAGGGAARAQAPLAAGPGAALARRQSASTARDLGETPKAFVLASCAS
jgi:DNA-binding response OmpR family regulator